MEVEKNNFIELFADSRFYIRYSCNKKLRDRENNAVIKQGIKLSFTDFEYTLTKDFFSYSADGFDSSKVRIIITIRTDRLLLC